MVSQRPRVVPAPANSYYGSRSELQQDEDRNDDRGRPQEYLNEKGQKPTTSAKDWTDEDPDNPQTWPLAKRVYHTVIPTAIGFLCPYGSSVYTPGSMQVESEFGISREVAILPFAFYLLGLAFGPILAAPISETFGRKVVYLIGLPIFALFTLGAGFSRGTVSLVVCRFFAGLFSSPGLSLGLGTLSDVWAQEERSLPAAIYVTAVQFGPAFG